VTCKFVLELPREVETAWWLNVSFFAPFR
jgi:hypothetical protein